MSDTPIKVSSGGGIGCLDVVLGTALLVFLVNHGAEFGNLVIAVLRRLAE